MTTQTLGFEIEGIPQTFKPKILTNGTLKSEEVVQYISIADNTGNPTKAIRLLGCLFVYNPNTQNMDQEDLVDEDMEIVDAELTDVIRFEKNIYVRKYRFDCIKNEDQQDTSHQPINGLMIDSSYMTLKTHNFSQDKDSPQHGDLIFYKNKFWIIEETSKSFMYTPKERMILYLSLKKML